MRVVFIFVQKFTSQIEEQPVYVGVQNVQSLSITMTSGNDFSSTIGNVFADVCFNSKLKIPGTSNSYFTVTTQVHYSLVNTLPVVPPIHYKLLLINSFIILAVYYYYYVTKTSTNYKRVVSVARCMQCEKFGVALWPSNFRCGYHILITSSPRATKMGVMSPFR